MLTYNVLNLIKKMSVYQTTNYTKAENFCNRLKKRGIPAAIQIVKP